jgi:hypothetical protein
MSPTKAAIRAAGLWAPVAVNALAVGGDLPLDHGSRAEEGGALTRWLGAQVIRGPGAFVEAADDWRDFAAAMERKLLREIAGGAFAGDDAARDRPGGVFPAAQTP